MKQIYNWCEKYGIDIHFDEFEACFDDNGVFMMDKEMLEKITE